MFPTRFLSARACVMSPTKVTSPRGSSLRRKLSDSDMMNAPLKAEVLEEFARYIIAREVRFNELMNAVASQGDPVLDLASVGGCLPPEAVDMIHARSPCPARSCNAGDVALASAFRDVGPAAGASLAKSEELSATEMDSLKDVICATAVYCILDSGAILNPAENSNTPSFSSFPGAEPRKLPFVSDLDHFQVWWGGLPSHLSNKFQSRHHKRFAAGSKGKVEAQQSATISALGMGEVHVRGSPTLGCERFLRAETLVSMYRKLANAALVGPAGGSGPVQGLYDWLTHSSKVASRDQLVTKHWGFLAGSMLGACPLVMSQP